MAGNIIKADREYVISGELRVLINDIATILTEYYEDKDINKEKLFGLLGIFAYMTTDKMYDNIRELKKQ